MQMFPRGWRGWLFALGRVAAILGGMLALILLLCWSTTWMPGASHTGPLAPLTPEQVGLRARLTSHVQVLARDIGQRSSRDPAKLDRAADYGAKVLREAGFEVSMQAFVARNVTVRNVIAERRGATCPGEIVVVGGHYDAVEGSPGADDNGTGTAAVLEVARLLAGKALDRTVRYVLFVNEEPPFFQNTGMGSRELARAYRAQGDDIVAMFSLEAIGYYCDEPGCQAYPPPFSLFFPSEGNFVAFVGNLSSRTLVRRSVEVFRDTTPFPSEGVAAPAWVNGIDFSDQWSFWEEGYPGLMITDTAVFRNPHYHRLSDTPETIDADRFTRVVAGIARVVEDAAMADKP